MSKDDNRFLYDKRKKLHICTKCEKQDAYTLIGKSRCYECTRKRNEQSRKNYDDTERKKLANRRAELRNNRIQNKQCTRCGKTLSENQTKKMCETCLARSRAKNAKYRLENRVMPRFLFDGVQRCIKCGKEQVADGYKVCNDCLEKCRKSLEKARATPHEPSGFQKEIYNYFQRRTQWTERNI